MSTRRKLWTATALAVACIAWLVLHSAEKKTSKPGPSKDFVKGFEAGVRYGLIAHGNSPKEDSLPKLTQEAAWWYCLTTEDKGKTLGERATTSVAKEH